MRDLSIRMHWAEKPHKLRTDYRGIARIASLVKHGRVGMTQKALAEKAGVCPGTVGRLERGRTRSPHFRTVVDILNALGFDVTSHARPT